MRPVEEIITSNRLRIVRRGEDGFIGFVIHPRIRDGLMSVICSWGDGWDHVSVAYRNRTPTWSEMCFIKEIFFDDEECVVQYHPPKSEAVNIQPYCLHLWKKQGAEFELPPKEMV